MSVANSRALLERLRAIAENECASHALIPVEDAASILLAFLESAAIAAEIGPSDMTLILDGVTAGEIDGMARAQQAALQTVVVGETLPPWAGAKGVRHVERPAHVGPGDRFLVVLSRDLHLAVVAQHQGEDGASSRGAWTGHGPTVARFAGALSEGLDLAIPETPETIPAPGSQEEAVYRISAKLARHFAHRQRDMALDRSDLASVLDILKAISARRRAHDILYVFVEKIASVVGIDRCSVVRVWDTETIGHVLASHEDESVFDLVIELNKYPELCHALEERTKVVVNDVKSHRLTAPFADEMSRAGITSLLVIPIILNDAEVGSFFLRAARKGGAFSPRELSFCEIVSEAAANALERAHLFESIQKANQRLEHLAITDGLTGLYNHRHFRERLQDEFERAKRYRLPLACMLIDVDDFKKFNDTYGHLIGDYVLKELATRTLKSVRKNDMVARYGGEELVAIMPQTGAEGAELQAQRLLAEVSGDPYDGIPEDVTVTVSIGVGTIDPDTMKSIDDIIQKADAALYLAKSTGKNKVVVAGSEDS